MKVKQLGYNVWWASWLVLCGTAGIVLSVDHRALGVMLNASLGLENEEAISVTADNYKAHFLKRGKFFFETIRVRF